MKCEHRYTHPNGCDDCPAQWCWICKGYHEPPLGCQPCVDSQLAARDAELDKARATIEGLRSELQRLREVVCEVEDVEAIDAALAASPAAEQTSEVALTTVGDAAVPSPVRSRNPALSTPGGGSEEPGARAS